MATPDAKLRAKIMMVCPPKPPTFRPKPTDPELATPPKPPMSLDDKARMERFTSSQKQEMQNFILRQQATAPKFSAGYVQEWLQYWEDKKVWEERVVVWQHAHWLNLFTELTLNEFKNRGKD